jgi:arylsulfatase A-like enzyme
LQSGPFFLFINFNDAHDPYRPPRPFSSYFSDTVFPQLYRLKKKVLSFLNREDKKSLDAFLISQYDGEIAYLDDQLGKFFSRLKLMGLYDSSLIIITSDHGELFGEHGLYYHRTSLYQGVVNVPLIIKYPFSKRVGSEKRMISLADLFPTILAIGDLPIPGNISGKAFGKGSLPIVSELYNYGIGEHRALNDGEYKYMRYQQQREPELYDLRNDLMEKDNLVHLLPVVTREMEEELRKWEIAHTQKFTAPAKKEGNVSKEIWEGLKALGYIQ